MRLPSSAGHAEPGADVAGDMGDDAVAVVEDGIDGEAHEEHVDGAAGFDEKAGSPGQLRPEHEATEASPE